MVWVPRSEPAVCPLRFRAGLGGRTVVTRVFGVCNTVFIHLHRSMPAFACTVLLFAVGVLFATDFLLPYHSRVDSPRPDPIAACTRFDAIHYKDIVESGYFYDPGRRSNVAFFPGYPVAASALHEGIRPANR